ncbi:hypothetical protein ACHAXT_010723 [Thalassiosira profunda]
MRRRTPGLPADQGPAGPAPANGGQTPNVEGGSGGAGGGKKKKRRGPKKPRAATATATTDEKPPNGNGEPNGASGDHKHARDASVASSADRPHKKRKSKSQGKPQAKGAPTSRSPCTIICFLIATCTLPVMVLCTAAFFSCGTDLEEMSKLVLLEKAKGASTVDMLFDVVRGASAECTAVSAVDDYLKRSSADCGGSRLAGDDARKKKGRRKKSDISGDEDIATAFRKRACQLSSVALGSLVHYMGTDPFQERYQSEVEEKRGIFKRVTSEHKKKHKEHEQLSSASEEIDRKHPLRHILEGASIFWGRKKEKTEAEGAKKKTEKRGEEGGEIEVDWKKWKYAMSDDYELESDQASLVKELATRVISRAKKMTVCRNVSQTNCSEADQQIASLSEGTSLSGQPLQERLDAVAWGGIDDDATRWWPRKDATDPKKVAAQSEGGRLLAAYLKIMKWVPNLHVKYPFRLCKEGCDSEVAILHTLEWRTKYQPWCVSDSTVQFNKAGFVYNRGHSRAGPKQRAEEKDASSLAQAGHSMVWYRPGLASPSDDPELYGRTMINALEMAVADSLVRNKGTIGRFNVVMDCEGMGSKNSPSMTNVKKLFSVLQDHFPDRLGVLLAANLSGLTQMLMKMVLPFVTEDVRAKIHIIPNAEEERREMLLQFMDESEIPDWLGGNDDYRFDANEYYEGKCILPEEGILEYRTTMPYHA